MENKQKLFSALVKAQLELKNPPKNKDGYNYKYASLDRIIDLTKPVLAKHGLCVVQTLSSGEATVGITTMIIHESGESISDTLMLPATEMKGTNSVQALGASITYGRRYGLCAILGISADDDTDAADDGEKTEAPSANRFNPTVNTNGTQKATNGFNPKPATQVPAPAPNPTPAPAPQPTPAPVQTQAPAPQPAAPAPNPAPVQTPAPAPQPAQNPIPAPKPASFNVPSFGDLLKQTKGK